MEKIIVKNFLILENIEMPINKFNLVIGEQASGKSLLSKLVYYFKNNLDDFISCVVNEKSYDEFVNRLEKSFLLNFPNEYWKQNKSFEISYEINSYYFQIKSDFRRNSRVNLILSEEFSKVFNELKNTINVWKEEFRNRELSEVSEGLRLTIPFELHARENITKALKESNISGFFQTQTFIPSSRSFFANLQKNYWSLTDDILDIDPLISRFGKSYDNAKNLYNIISKHDVFKPKVDVSNCLNEVIKAEYQEIDGDDWIVNDSYKVRLSRASSGQQEAFPMLLILMMNNYRIAGLNFHSMYIEEPEAHLFPDAQAKVVSAILKIFSKQDTNFFITTHSPYILTSINNSIYANQLIESGKVTEEKFVDISNGSYPINFSDISAYSITKGQITDIKDYELNLIDGTFLDSISNNFGKIFNQLLDLDS